MQQYSFKQNMEGLNFNKAITTLSMLKYNILCILEYGLFPNMGSPDKNDIYKINQSIVTNTLCMLTKSRKQLISV